MSAASFPVRVAPWLLLGGVVSTCAEPTPPASQPPRSQEKVVTVPSDRTGAPMVASVAPSAAPKPAATPAPKLATPSSTPGKVWCETELCDLATEVCCIVDNDDGTKDSHCAPRAPAGSSKSACCPNAGFCGNRGMTLERSCDERSDCPSGEQCCEQTDESDLWRQFCAAHCTEDVCLAGSTCKNGNTCESDRGAVGLCPLQIYPPTCDGVKCTKGQLCCWSSSTRQGRCADECAAADDFHFQCTSSAQCRPYRCNSYSGSPVYSCGGGGFVGGFLCDSLKDCPKYAPTLGSGPGSPTAKACSQHPSMPRGMKTCDYE